jgi:hypothetical protein
MIPDGIRETVGEAAGMMIAMIAMAKTSVVTAVIAMAMAEDKTSEAVVMIDAMTTDAAATIVMAVMVTELSSLF